MSSVLHLELISSYLISKGFYRYTGFFELLPNTPFMKFLTQTFCQEGMPTQYICEYVTIIIGGFSQEIDHVSSINEYAKEARIIRVKRDSDLLM